VTPAQAPNAIRTFFDDNGNSIDFSDPCFSDECKQIKSILNQESGIKCHLLPEAFEVIKIISQITAQSFKTSILPLEFINKRIDKIAVEDSFIGDVNIYTAAFTPHVL
jgi:hypothetical protein